METREAALYKGWKHYGSHLKEYASEFAGTAFLLFCVVGAVALTFSPVSLLPALVSSPHLRLALVGILLGGASWLVALSPPGRLSGAHLDAAVSSGFWLLGKMHKRDLLGYIAAQMAGAVAGTFLGGLAFGAAARLVQMGLLHPGPPVSFWETVGDELAATSVLTLTVYTSVSFPKTACWTPGISLIALTFLVATDGNYSGAGTNPACWFGPALLAGTGKMRSHTAKLFHDPRYRSIFRHDTAPSQPPASICAESR